MPLQKHPKAEFRPEELLTLRPFSMLEGKAPGGATATRPVAKRLSDQAWATLRYPASLRWTPSSDRSSAVVVLSISVTPRLP